MSPDIDGRKVANAAAIGTAATLALGGLLLLVRQASASRRPTAKRVAQDALALPVETYGLLNQWSQKQGRPFVEAAMIDRFGYGRYAGAILGTALAFFPRRWQRVLAGTGVGMALWGASRAGWIPSTDLMGTRRAKHAPPSAQALAHAVYGGILGASLLERRP